MMRVTLYNQHAMCGISACGRYPLDAYRRAIAKAGMAFTQYRGDWCTLEDNFAPLFEHARKSWRRAHFGAVHVAYNGLGVELQRHEVRS